jgi:hypothetical protein
MPNRKQIIAITVLGIVALMLGCKPNATGIGNVASDPIKPKPDSAEPKPKPVKPKPNPIEPTPNPVKPRTISQKNVVGTYERKAGASTSRYVLLEFGIMESYRNGKKGNSLRKWSIVGNEMQFVSSINEVYIYRINPDISITWIASIYDGKRYDTPKDNQFTWKKINQPKLTRNLILEERDIVGTYEWMSGTNTYRHVFLDNGIQEWYVDGKNQNKDSKWSLVENELHIVYPNGNVNFWKVNPDNSITLIAYIKNKKRTDTPKEEQRTTWKKIN